VLVHVCVDAAHYEREEDNENRSNTPGAPYAPGILAPREGAHYERHLQPASAYGALTKFALELHQQLILGRVAARALDELHPGANEAMSAERVADSGFWPFGYWCAFDQVATLIPPKGYTYADAAP
jgi:hypothetical protein